MEALISLLKTQGPLTEAPCSTRRVGKWYQVVIGIGDDDVAYLTLDDEALATLIAQDPTLSTLLPEDD